MAGPAVADPGIGRLKTEADLQRFVEDILSGQRFSPDQIVGGGGVPPGTLLGFGGATAPAGYLLCDGSAVSRTQYAALFAAIGTTYGAGDGSTTFNLPDARGRAIFGADLGTGRIAFTVPGSNGGESDHILTVAEMPTHNHPPITAGKNFAVGTTTRTGTAGGVSQMIDDLSFNGQTGLSGLEQPHNNMPPYLCANWIIKA